MYTNQHQNAGENTICDGATLFQQIKILSRMNLFTQIIMTEHRPNEPTIKSSCHVSSTDMTTLLRAVTTFVYSNTVQCLVTRNEDGSRNTPQTVRLSTELGVVNDRWCLDPARNMNEQIAAMSHQIASSISNGQPLTLFGDALFLDMDVSTLVTGSRLKIGDCLLEVTPEPHNPCNKFRKRFGHPAFMGCVTHKHLNIRGVYLRVLTGGALSIGDPIQVIHTL